MSPTAGRAPKPTGTARVSVSPTVVVAVAVISILAAIAAALYFGPWTVGTEWAAMSGSANDEVTDVVQYALQAYESERGLYNPNKSHLVPAVQGPVTFVEPIMSFTMPRRIVFRGKTNKGNFVGTFDTKTGEVIADIESGGYSFGGLVDINKATSSFRMTGNEKDGKVTAESGGKPLVIIRPPPEEP